MSEKADKFGARCGKIFFGILCDAVYSSSSFQFPAANFISNEKRQVNKKIN